MEIEVIHAEKLAFSEAIILPSLDSNITKTVLPEIAIVEKFNNEVNLKFIGGVYENGVFLGKQATLKHCLKSELYEPNLKGAPESIVKFVET